MAIFEADPEALQNLISRLDEAAEKLEYFRADTSQAGHHFLETFLSPQKPQVEDEVNRLIDHLRCARDVDQNLQDFLRKVLIYLKEEIHVPFQRHG